MLVVLSIVLSGCTVSEIELKESFEDEYKKGYNDCKLEIMQEDFKHPKLIVGMDICEPVICNCSDWDCIPNCFECN